MITSFNSAAIYFLVASVMLALLIDLRVYRIPNVLVIAIFVVGLAYQATVGGAQAVLIGIAGSLIGLACLLPMYVTRAMGAGDVKLMAAVGTYLGLTGSLVAVAGTLISGAVLAVLATRLPFLRYQPSFDATAALSDRPISDQARVMRIPYAGAIASGTLVALWQQGLLGL